MRHVNENCGFTIQAIAAHQFVDVVHNLRKRYFSISQIRWSSDLAISSLAVW